MRPVLFTIFGVKIYGYGTMIAIGILSALFFVGKKAKENNYDEDSILNMSIITIISGVAGGKLLYLITDIRNIIQNPESLRNFGEGFVIYGAIIGGALAIFYYSNKKKWKSLKIFDMIIPSIALAQGFGRIGCFFAGCCYGEATNLPIGVIFNKSPFAPQGIMRHPTQIYSSIFDFLLFAFLMYYSKKERKDGRVFSMYIILYSVGRFIVEFFRDDPRGNVGILSTSQFISIFTLILGIIFYNLDKIKKKQE